jgi:hypothetical protein
MSAAYVRCYYRVPAKRGTRVIADGKPGTIVSFPGKYIGVRLDGETRVGRWHPTWRIDYLDESGAVVFASPGDADEVTR